MQIIRLTVLAAIATGAVLLLAGCATGESSTKSNRTASTSSKEPLKCGPGEVVMCQTNKTGFGRLSTGRNTNYDHCSCEPSGAIMQDRNLPQ